MTERGVETIPPGGNRIGGLELERPRPDELPGVLDRPEAGS